MKNKFYLLNKNLIPAYAYFALTAFAFFFSKIYTIFSHGEPSEDMASMWIFLLFAGTIFYTLTAVVFTLLKRQLNRASLAVYSSGVVAYTAGMFVRGFLGFFGADKHLIPYYQIAGIGLMGIGFLLIVICSKPFTKRTRKLPKAMREMVNHGISPQVAAETLVRFKELSQEEANAILEDLNVP